MKKRIKPLISVLLALAMIVPSVALPVSTVTSLVASAANYVYDVELGFNNLFIFEDWARNKNSTTVVGGTTQGVGTLTTDIDNGTFTLTKTNSEAAEVYTGHGMDKENAMSNMDYYKISVEPNTTYSLSYNLSGTVNAANFFVTVFMFDSDNLCLVWSGNTAKVIGNNSFVFTTPAETDLVQIRFGISGANTTPNATVSNISLSECEVVVDSANLFNFDTWAGTSSGTTVGVSGYVYADGKVEPNTTDDIITMSLNAGGSLFTGFSLDTTEGYYTIPVAANSNYVLNYTLVNSLNTDYKQFTPYIVMKSTSGAITYVEGMGATGYGQGSCIFTTGADTASISPVFAVSGSDTPWTVEVKDIKFMAATVTDGAMSPHRLVKTYGEDTTYGTLPTPTAPAKHIFAGWNTKKDGTGTQITADTAVYPMSLTVYPDFEPAVDTLTVKTLPSKTVYTVGEKLNTEGLVLTATVNGTNGNSTFDVAAGYYCTPEVLNTVGTQTITATYGGKSVTFTVTVKENDPGVIVVNGVSTNVTVANNEYTFNLSTSAFNRYEVTYKSDSYVCGVATFNDGTTEDFFLEPSDNGHFSSYINDFLTGNTYNQVVKIKFTTLDKEFGNFELISLNTIATTDLSKSVYMSNHKFEMGIALDSGGVVSELYDVSGNVYARTYSTTHNYKDGNGDVTVNRTQVDYVDKLDEHYGSGYKEQSTKVNLINTYDQGRFLQQSYYGSGEYPYVQSEYNNAAWPYNPVQGGNVIGEASKIIDYKVTDEYIYVKARPLDWAKWSDDYVDPEGRPIYDEISWGDDYITDTYVEAWYYFQGDTIKVTNRKVDYSGLADNVHSQEFPALYLVEPLNHYVYNNVSKEDAWDAPAGSLTQYDIPYSLDIWKAEHEEGKLINMEEPEYWGLTQAYITAKGYEGFEPWTVCNENWAAFTASEDSDSFGVGIYTDVTSKFYYGVQPAIYQQTAGGSEGSVDKVLDTLEYRHTKTATPSPELPTSYIAPTDTMTFRSFEPTEFTYYLATGTSDEIREDFRPIAENTAEAEKAKPKIAVPETVYMTPADGVSTLGQYYANNVLNANNYYSVETKTDYADMYLGVYADNDHTHISVNVENVTTPSEDVDVRNTEGTASYDDIVFKFTDDTDPNPGTFIFPAGLDMDFDEGGGLEPGEKATVKWTITTYAEDPSSNPDCVKETFVAYTVMYAPGRTVGAVAEARRNDNSNNELSSWITGANGVDHSQRAPLGSYKGDYHDSGYFQVDPLYNEQPKQSGSSQSEDDYIIVDGINGAGTSIDYTEDSYVLQTAPNGEDDTRSQSYLGLLAIDKSRYKNTSQIPNLKIGWDALRVGNNPKESFDTYNTYYTLGTVDSFVSTNESETPVGWTTNSSYSKLAGVKGVTIPYRETLVPSYAVTDDIDGKYIHAIAYGRAYNTLGNSYSTAGTSVLISVTDKSALRDAVTDGYGIKDPSDEFLENLEEAATILGDPSASQEEIDRVTDIINEHVNIFYALKYDNLFSAYEMSQKPASMKVVGNRGTATYNDGTITVVNDTITGGEAYTEYGSDSNTYYLIDLEPNTEYVFEYTSETTLKAQAFMFFYNANGGAGDVPTNMWIKVNNGVWSSKSESNAWWGNYQNSAGKNTYAIKFTTGTNTSKAAFRFGNTSNDPVTSTFSNIKLIDSAHYYEDVTYTATETVYEEYAAYGALQVPVRPGYTFSGWIDKNGTSITAIDTATEHETIYSVWTENRYIINYDANGGSGTIPSTTVNYTDTVTLASSGFTYSGRKLAGWSTDPNASSVQYSLGESVSKLTDAKGGTVTLYAVWTNGQVNVTFDNLVDMKAWQASSAFTNNTNIDDVTNTGFSVTNIAGGNEKTVESTEFPVTAGKQYKIDIDITGDTWDVYIFFRSNSVSGTGINFQDSTNRFSYGGGGNASQIFTAPAGATKAVIRVDANQKSTAHTVNFENIRVYEYDGTPIEVTPSNAYYNIDAQYGTLPTPTKEGFTFTGWVDESNNAVTSTSTVPNDADGVVHLTSTWKINNAALESDKTVIDFGTPVAIDAIANDAILNNTATAYSATAAITGVSTDGTSFATTATGTYGTFEVKDGKVIYTPTAAMNGVDKVYYQAKLSAGYTDAVMSQIVVAPASNVLYEETIFTTKSGSTGVEWATVTDSGSSTSTGYQTDEGIYGYDSTYNNTKNYSNGTALNSNITSTNKRSKIITFSFTGTGFDLYSACGTTTGVQVVTLKDEISGKFVKSYIVDTYYGDSAYGTLYQVPIISETGLDFSKYSIQITASYLPSMSGALDAAAETQAFDAESGVTVNTAIADRAELRKALADLDMEYVLEANSVDVIWVDDNSVLNGGTGAETPATDALETAATDITLLNVVDAVRVYKPLEDGDTYYVASETGANYYNVMDNLINGVENGTITGAGKYIAYVSGTAEQEITVDNYNSIGPKDELYIAKTENQTAVAFTVNGFDKDSMKVMVSLRAAYGTPKAKIGTSEFTVASKTEMYYDITDYVGDDGTVTIQNAAADTSLLSVVAIKITGEVAEASALSSDINLMTARTMMMAPATEVEPNAPEVPEEPAVPEEPETSEEPEEPTNTVKSWIERLIEWVINVFTQVITTLKTVFGF